jgi:hypothetical protein
MQQFNWILFSNEHTHFFNGEIRGLFRPISRHDISRLTVDTEVWVDWQPCSHGTSCVAGYKRTKIMDIERDGSDRTFHCATFDKPSNDIPSLLTGLYPDPKLYWLKDEAALMRYAEGKAIFIGEHR